jgi:hypothetical protein
MQPVLLTAGPARRRREGNVPVIPQGSPQTPLTTSSRAGDLRPLAPTGRHWHIWRWQMPVVPRGPAHQLFAFVRCSNHRGAFYSMTVAVRATLLRVVLRRLMTLTRVSERG